MEKISSFCLCITMILGCLFITACGGGEKEETKAQEPAKTKTVPKTRKEAAKLAQEKFKKMQERTEAQDAQAAYEMAVKEAKNWDNSAQLYYLEGEKDLKSEGTAKHWTAMFALKAEPQNIPSKERGEKFVVVMMGGNIVQKEKKEAPQDVSYTKPCHAFLPDNWMSSKEAYTQCYAALEDEYGSEISSAVPQRLECLSGQYYISSKWEIIPTWRLTMKTKEKPVSAAIHAVNGEVLKIK